jgi:endonuclease YncB( thermonuclease family)
MAADKSPFFHAVSQVFSKFLFCSRSLLPGCAYERGINMKVVMLSALLLLAVPAAAQTAVDGDTIKLNGTLYELRGIDAPEMAQICVDGWPAGFESRKALADLMRSHRHLRGFNRSRR